jgi:DNA-binding NarL/FixJ family response regulator
MTEAGVTGAGVTGAGVTGAGVTVTEAGPARADRAETGPARADQTGRISVLIADDHPVVRQGLQVLLSVQDDIDVVGEAADGAQALDLAASLDPEVLLLDLKLPVLDGVAVLRELRDRGARTRALVLTSAAEGALVTRAVQAGAAGFLYKDVDPDALVRAVRSVNDGHTLLAPEAASAIVGSGAVGPAARGSTARSPAIGGIGALTRREREILAQLADGCSNREIARNLLVSEKTVKTHVSSILAKLGVADRTQAALLAVRQANP